MGLVPSIATICPGKRAYFSRLPRSTETLFPLDKSRDPSSVTDEAFILPDVMRLRLRGGGGGGGGGGGVASGGRRKRT